MEVDSYFETINHLHRQLKSLDERGLVLVLSAFAEDSLAELLKAYMFDNPATKKLVDGFDSPLGTLSARIRACYALGLITKGQYHDLEHLRTVRNMFSHTWEPISFENREVKKHIKAISYSNLIDQFPESLREKIEGSISYLLTEIKVVVGQVSETRSNPPVLGSRLYAGLTGTPEEQVVQCFEKLERIKDEVSVAKAERKEFMQHLKVCWMEKFVRAVSKCPKPEREKYIIKIFQYVEPNEFDLSEIYSQER